VALFVERAGGLWESAEAGVDEDGRVIIASSSSPHGQGHDVTFAQIAADRLDLELDRIELRFGDSAAGPPGVGTFGSRSVAVAGSAVALVSERLLAQARSLAADRLGVDAGGLRYERGSFKSDGRAVTLAELAEGGELRATARFDSDTVFSSGAYVATVEIEPETGRLSVVRVVAVDDSGTIINPMLAHGQVVGGVAQGLGECLLEEVAHGDDGQVRNASLMEYLLPSAAEMPPVSIGEVSTPTPLNPLGAKGVGEGGAIGTLAAVANAVADALGGRHVDPPYTPEKLWRAL
jgi:carbon-monoxide dehydrogenase large subunit